ncbi:NAD-dependent epimerase/dehydratase family protein [Edaphobacter albus]|uniref:NAD-dependent epimerase/dehydratase family protein n=1 Tax=Edaphobacter sp. 4G125 TaxID=2763071 RepID=UPI0016473EA2|nr:NAD-dependent epimerase/dehydratase family protein [Edaphobacter sp. 4G125]QNI36936.1 NAD-dependent epimerase/dehydratase family protein [Edaphobacter sp. 4G125]
MAKIALFGAAGAIGRSLADALQQRGEGYRVVGRDRARLEKTFGGFGVEIATWNLDDPASVREAARGIDTLIYLVGVPYNHFELHPQVMQKTLDGAIAENVRRILLIGTVYPYGTPVTAKVTEEHPRNPTTFKGKMRKEQEDLLLAADAAGKIEGVVLRLPDFYGPGVEASFLDGAFKAAVSGGTADMVGPIDTPHEFVFVPDVGPVALDLAAKPEARGHWWNLAGAGITSQRKMAEMAFALTGKPMKIRVAGKTMLRVIGLFKPFMRELVEMHYLQTNPVLLDDTALTTLLGTVKKTPYEDGVRQCVEYLSMQKK